VEDEVKLTTDVLLHVMQCKDCVIPVTVRDDADAYEPPDLRGTIAKFNVWQLCSLAKELASR